MYYVQYFIASVKYICIKYNWNKPMILQGALQDNIYHC